MTLLQSPIGDLTDQAALFVLLVQHDGVACESTVQTLEVTARWRVVHVPDIAETVEQMEVMTPTVALLDPLVSDIDDTELLRQFQALASDAGCTVILSAGSAEADIAQLAGCPSPGGRNDRRATPSRPRPRWRSGRPRQRGRRSPAAWGRTRSTCALRFGLRPAGPDRPGAPS